MSTIILCNPELLQWAKPGAEVIYAGKAASAHTLTQDQINQLLIDQAKAGKVVVRLKGGDPYVFGRGGEEAQELIKAGLEFEEVPGITSAVAAPAYAGIPVTHREHQLPGHFCHRPRRSDHRKFRPSPGVISRIWAEHWFFSWEWSGCGRLRSS